MKTKLLLVIGVLISLSTSMVFAHHSTAGFDTQNNITLDATVVKFKWTNPHAWIKVTVPNEEGEIETWSVEMTSPNNMMREGFKRSTFKPGDSVQLNVSPLKSGLTGGLFMGAKLADGTVLGNMSKESGMLSPEGNVGE